MIDNIKLVFTNKSVIEKWFNENKDKFNIKRMTISDEGILLYPIKAFYNGLELKICDKTAYIQGSLHKFYNKCKLNQIPDSENYDYLEDNNYNDFYYQEVLIALEEYKYFFDGLDLNSAHITELEFGFNIITKKPPKEYITQNFLLYQHKAPQNNYAEKGCYFKKFEHAKFGFKIYSKKDQKQLSINIMRIEIVLKSNHLKDIEIIFFGDLFKTCSIDNLYAYFWEKFHDFQLVDNRFERKEIPTNIVHKIGCLLEPSYWEIHKRKPNLDRKKKELVKLLTNYNLFTTKSYILQLLDSKYQLLRYSINNYLEQSD